MKVGLKKQRFLILVIAVVTCLVVLLGDLAFSRFTSSKAYACDHSLLSSADPTCPGGILNPGDRIGDAGAAAYQAAAELMQANNGSSQSLDELQKRHLRPHFGDLVDRVVVIYNANLMDEWSALGYRVDLGDSDAQAYCNRIYLDAPYQARDLDQIVDLAHELVHSRQCESYGGAGGFGWHYFKEYYEAGNDYRNNSLEREAFDFEDQFSAWLDDQTTLLAQLSNGQYEIMPNDQIVFSPFGGNPIVVYSGSQRALALVLYRGAVYTAFDGGGIYRSPDGLNLGGGGDTTRVYPGTQTVRAILACQDSIFTAFSGGGIYRSPDGQNLGGGGSTTRVYNGSQLVTSMQCRGNSVVTTFNGGGIYESPDGQNLGGGGRTFRLN